MKTTYIYIRILILSVLVSVWSFGARAQQPIMGGEATVTALDVTRDGGEVKVKMSVDVTNLTVGGDETVVFTPVLVKSERSLDLPSVEIMGRRAYLYHVRNDRQTVTDSPAYAERTARRAERREGPQIIEYAVTLPFEGWMRGSDLTIREGSCGCNNTLLALGEDPLGNVLPPYEPQYVLSFVEPDPEPVKVREERFSAYINFRIDRWAVLENYRNNASELAGIQASFERVKEDDDLTIRSVTIEGWASPEAPEDYNLRLSQRRADALADYLAARNDLDRSTIRATGRGEDWAGLRKGADTLKLLLDREKVLAVIDDTSLSMDARESRLKELVPPAIFQRLYNEIYPALRRNDYCIVYNVRNFEPSEVRALLDTDPQKLSLSEMYRLAGLYGEGTAEYAHVMEVAARTYPETPAAAVNGASQLIGRGEYDAAEALLLRSDISDVRVLNALGLACARRGDTQAARAAWSEAAEKGFAEAEHNLGELARSLE